MSFLVINILLSQLSFVFNIFLEILWFMKIKIKHNYVIGIYIVLPVRQEGVVWIVNIQHF